MFGYSSAMYFALLFLFSKYVFYISQFNKNVVHLCKTGTWKKQRSKQRQKNEPDKKELERADQHGTG